MGSKKYSDKIMKPKTSKKNRDRIMSLKRKSKGQYDKQN